MAISLAPFSPPREHRELSANEIKMVSIILYTEWSKSQATLSLIVCALRYALITLLRCANGKKSVLCARLLYVKDNYIEHLL